MSVICLHAKTTFRVLMQGVKLSLREENDKWVIGNNVSLREKKTFKAKPSCNMSLFKFTGIFVKNQVGPIK